jgi:hypothetical protein
VATTFQITAVRTVLDHSRTHSHIVRVRINGQTSGEGLARETVVRDLLTPYGDRYITYADGARADVVVRRCPHCSRQDYITTTPDTTTKNNLLSLPKF